MNIKDEIEIQAKLMTKHGINFNVDKATKLINEYDAQIDAAQSIIKPSRMQYDNSGKKFAINSPKVISDFVYKFLKHEVKVTTKAGQPSTASEVLLQFNDKVCDAIVTIRSLSKQIVMIQNLIDATAPDGKIHSTFIPYGTTSGRYTSSDPNLQQIPDTMRYLFEAPEHRVFLHMDLRQIEYRVIAQYAQAKEELLAFENNVDFHQFMADKLGVDRQRAKIINFAIAYGMSPYGVGQQLGVSEEEGAKIINEYFKNRPEVARWIENTKAAYRVNNLATTLDGTTRRVDPSEDRVEDKAVATIVQGTAADLLKRATVSVAQLLAAHPEWEAHIVLSLHDELVIEANTSIDETAVMFTFTTRQEDFSVPLASSIHIDKTWIKK